MTRQEELLPLRAAPHDPMTGKTGGNGTERWTASGVYATSVSDLKNTLRSWRCRPA